MIIEFHDQHGQRFHDEFNDWRRQHQDAYYLSFSKKTFALLHDMTCHHIGGFDWDGYMPTGELHSATKNRKVCAESTDELLSWAEKEGVTVKPCSSCLKELPVITYKATQLHTAKKETTSKDKDSFDTPYAVSAVEGILRETIAITKSRDGKLRKAALEKARGICETCSVDYSSILDGLGKRVLQVHHRKQLSLAIEPVVNGIEDLAVVCANCHQIIHADIKKAMSVEELRKRLRK